MRRDPQDYYVDAHAAPDGGRDYAVCVIIERDGDGSGMTIPLETARLLRDRLNEVISHIEASEDRSAAVGDGERET